MNAGKYKKAAVTETLVTRLFDSQPDAVVWFTPIYSPGKKKLPDDFEVGYCNNAACKILGADKEIVKGSTLKTSPLLDKVSRQRIFEQCLELWTTEMKTEFTYHSPKLDQYLNVQRSKVEGGILSISRDHTLLIKTRAEKEQQTLLLDQLIANSPYGIALYESIRSMNGEIRDFRMKICNQKSSDITALSMEEMYKYTVKELMVLRGQSDFFSTVVKVVETGEPALLDYYSKTRAQWIAFSIVKFGDGYLLNYIDITKTKLLEKQALRQADMLEGILNASFTSLIAMEAIYGFSGKVLDFKFIMFNKACAKYISLKPEDKNKTLLTLFPVAKSNGLFDLLLKVLSTGEPIVTDFHHKIAGIDKRFNLSVAKMGDHGIVQSFTEITEKE